MSAVTSNEYTQQNTTTRAYSFTFPYLKTSDIKASLDGVATTAFTLPNATTLQFNTVPTQGAKIRIFRETGIDDLTATFYAGSAIKSEDLNDNFTQNLFVTQEVNARFLSILGGTMIEDLTMGEDTKIIFEGATDDAHETTITVADPTADRTITFPNVSGNVVTTGDTGTVARAMIAGDAVNGDKIANDSINSEHYVDASIDTQHIAADQITNALIADNQIDSEHYVDGSIDRVHLAADIVDGTKIADDAIANEHIATDAVNADSVANNAIDTNAIQNLAVTTGKLADNAVTQSKMADDSVGTAELVDGSVDTDRLADNSVTLAKMTNNSVGTSELVDASVTEAKIADDAVSMDKLSSGVLPTDISIASANIVDGTIITADVADDAITNAKIADGTLDGRYFTETELLGGSLDGRYYTETESEARFLRQDSSETIASGVSWSSSDAFVATTAAIDARVIDLVDDVGGFVPIANETSFPTANPDVNNGAGTIVSVKTASTNLTPSSGSVSISNGAGSGNTVTLTGVTSTIPSGYGFLVETTSTLHTYTFHRLVPKATEVTTVASNAVAIAAAGNNVTDINNFYDLYQISTSAPTSRADSTSLQNGDLWFDSSSNKVLMIYDGSSGDGFTAATPNASDLVNINIVAGQLVYQEDLGLITNTVTSGSGNNSINTVAGSISNVNSVAGSISNVNAVASNATNINNVAADATDIGAVAAKATEIGRLGTADAVADMNTLGTSAIVTDMDTLADISSNITTVAGVSSNVTTVAGISSNVTTVAGISGNVTAVANDAADIGAVAGKATEIGRLGTADAVADLAILGTTDVVADLNTLGTTAIVSDMDTLADIASNITTVANNDSNVTAVASNSSNINSAVSNASNINSAVSNASNINTVAGISSNVTTVATNNANVTTVAGSIANVNTAAGAISNINNVSGSIANVNTAASNLSSINSFANLYRIASSAPSSNNDEGDLYFDTTSNELRVYNGSAWQGGVTATGNLAGTGANTFTGDQTVNANIVITGTVDGKDISALGITGTTLANGVIATTQSAGDNSTKVATTAYTDTAITNLVDSSPSALNTLNELAAALGDDANFATTVNNSIASNTTLAGTKLPKAGGQMTGNITFSGTQTVDGRDVSVDGTKLDGIEANATADQTASEIVALISGQTIAPNVITTTNLTLDFGSIA